MFLYSQNTVKNIHTIFMRSLFSISILLIMFVCAGTVNAQRANYDVIPMPKSVKVDSVKVFNLCKDAGVAPRLKKVYDIMGVNYCRQIE